MKIQSKILYKVFTLEWFGKRAFLQEDGLPNPRPSGLVLSYSLYLITIPMRNRGPYTDAEQGSLYRCGTGTTPHIRARHYC